MGERQWFDEALRITALRYL